MHEQLQGAGERSRRKPWISERVYTRPMPEGGYLRVELIQSELEDAMAEHLRGRVVMERRAPAPATPEEEHIIVAELEGDDPNAMIAELFRIARDNAPIGRRILRQLRQESIGRTD